jgi:hypothetical protein
MDHRRSAVGTPEGVRPQDCDRLLVVEAKDGLEIRGDLQEAR